MSWRHVVRELVDFCLIKVSGATTAVSLSVRLTTVVSLTDRLTAVEYCDLVAESVK